MSSSKPHFYLVAISLILLLVVQSSVAKIGPGVAPNSRKDRQTDHFMNNASSLLVLRDTLSSLNLREQSQCINPTYHQCPNFPNKCASPGYYCCDEVYSCPYSDNCRGAFQCCPKNAQTCGGKECCRSGSACCKAGSGCCSPGEFCCSNYCCYNGESCCPSAGGCCYSGYKCCEGTCCPDGSSCAGNGLCLYPDQTTYYPPPTENTETSTLPTSTSRTPIPTETFSTPDFSVPSDTNTATNTATSSAPTPTITFIYVPGLTDVLVANMCLGMRKRGKQNLDVLTYAGPSGKSAKRRAAGCVRGYCNTSKTNKTCDEYPFASTSEGGAGAQIACVPDYQNIEQGWYINAFRSSNNLQVGQKFGVSIVGIACDSVVSIPSISKRDYATSAGYNATVLPPLSYGNKSLNYAVMPLGDLDAGSYNVSVFLNDQIDSFIILDGDGEQYVHSGPQTPGKIAGYQTVNFNLDEDGIGIGMTVLTSSKTLNVTWSYSGNTTTSTSNNGHHILAHPTSYLLVLGLMATILSL